MNSIFVDINTNTDLKSILVICDDVNFVQELKKI